MRRPLAAAVTDVIDREKVEEKEIDTLMTDEPVGFNGIDGVSAFRPQHLAARKLNELFIGHQRDLAQAAKECDNHDQSEEAGDNHRA